jgi:hypothetical protein
MRRFLVCSGIYGQTEALTRLETLVRERRPDGLLFAGGVLARPREYAPASGSEFGYTKEEAVFVEHFFSTLGRLDIFSAIIPGVFDASLDLFLHLGMKAELEYRRLHLVHATPIVEGDVAIFGLGACIDGYKDTDIGYYSQTLAEYYFRPLWTIEKPRTVLLLPEPLQGWHGDVENRRWTDALIATYHPQVCVLGSPCVCRGVEHIASTLLISPGYLSEGCAAWLDWNHHGDDQVEFLHLRKPATQQSVRSEEPPRVAEVTAGASRRP